MIRSFLVLAASSVLFLGCGIFGGGDHACDLRPERDQCTDWRNLIGPTVTQEALCRTLAATGNGTWKPNERCPSEGSVGGCQTKTVGTNILQTNWFYAPKTEAEVRAECEDDGTTFVTPD
jgi:hypothetical protein